MGTDLARVVDELLAALARCWQESDSAGYAAFFHPEADFVDVLGRIVRGRDAIADIHRRNFDTIHLHSRVELRRLSTQRLADDVALAHVNGRIEVPAGPLEGTSSATQTLVLTNTGGEWRIRAFHNTFIREMAGVPTVE